LGLSVISPQRDGRISIAIGVFQMGAGLVFYSLGSRALPTANLTLLSVAKVLLGPFWVWLSL